MAFAVVFHPTGLVAQREPATLSELNLEDRSALYQPTIEDVPQGGARGQARQRFLAEIVEDADGLLEVVRGTRAILTPDGAEDKALVAAAAVLARILGQDIERDEHGPRLKHGVAADRLISVRDPEMRHGRKSSSHRFNGHKAQIAVDTDSQLITAVDVPAGNAPDAGVMPRAAAPRQGRSGNSRASRPRRAAVSDSRLCVLRYARLPNPDCRPASVRAC